MFLGWQAHDVQHHGRYVPETQLRHGAHVRLQKTADSPQLQSVQVVDISFVPQRQIPMVQAFPQTTETPQLPFDFRWLMPCCAFCAGSLPRCGAEFVSYGPDCSSDH